MADYHILTQDEKKKTVTVIFHIPITSASVNAANITWQDAIVKEAGGADNITSQLPDITTEELSSLKSGSLVELRHVVRYTSTNLTNEQRKAQIEASFKKVKADLVAEKQVTLEWMGYAGTVS